MLTPGERAISREQALVMLERRDEVEGQLRHLRDGVRQLLADVDKPAPLSRVSETDTHFGYQASRQGVHG